MQTIWRQWIVAVVRRGTDVFVLLECDEEEISVGGIEAAYALTWQIRELSQRAIVQRPDQFSKAVVRVSF